VYPQLICGSLDAHESVTAIGPVGLRGSMWITMPNFVKIGQITAKIR